MAYNGLKSAEMKVGWNKMEWNEMELRNEVLRSGTE